MNNNLKEQLDKIDGCCDEIETYLNYAQDHHDSESLSCIHKTVGDIQLIIDQTRASLWGLKKELEKSSDYLIGSFDSKDILAKHTLDSANKTYLKGISKSSSD